MCCRPYPTLFPFSFLIRQICKLAKRTNCRKTVKFRLVPLRAPFFVCGFVLLLHSILSWHLAQFATHNSSEPQEFFACSRFLFFYYYIFCCWLINWERRESHRSSLFLIVVASSSVWMFRFSGLFAFLIDFSHNSCATKSVNERITKTESSFPQYAPRPPRPPSPCLHGDSFVVLALSLSFSSLP